MLLPNLFLTINENSDGPDLLLHLAKDALCIHVPCSASESALVIYRMCAKHTYTGKGRSWS